MGKGKIKIIKHGEPKYVRALDYRLECDNCGCIFEFSIGDFEWEDEINENAAVRCPDCNKEIIFNSSEHLI